MDRDHSPSEYVPIETRITSSTGGQKGQKLNQFSTMPSEVMAEIGRCYGCGAHKYSRDNFRKGFDWSLSTDALMRHFMLWMGGETWDHDPGYPAGESVHHLASVIWHAATLMHFELQNKGTDDRGVTTDAIYSGKKRGFAEMLTEEYANAKAKTGHAL